MIFQRLPVSCADGEPDLVEGRVVEQRIRFDDAQELRADLARARCGRREREKRDGDKNEGKGKAFHCLLSVNCPAVTGPVHEFDPVYVPVIVGDETSPVPDTVLVQVANGGSSPPAGSAIEKLIDDADTVPETVPCPFTLALVSNIVSVPVKSVLTCVRRHVIWPGPDESEAVPLHVPATSAGGVGAGRAGSVGDGVPPLPQAETFRTAHRTTALTAKLLTGTAIEACIRRAAVEEGEASVVLRYSTLERVGYDAAGAGNRVFFRGPRVIPCLDRTG